SCSVLVYPLACGRDPGREEREGGERWIEQEARAGRGLVSEGGWGVSNCEWRKNGSVDDETGTWRSASHVATCPYTNRDWGGVGGGTHPLPLGRGVTANTH
ncbi:unnamed protein product, partial [Tetraodon nigroviridis]